MGTRKHKICQVACNTYGEDPRVVWRTTKSLSDHYQVSLIINSPPEIREVKCINIPRHKSLIKRALLVHPLVLIHCLRMNAKVYHFHNPELILLFFFLKLLGKKIIFDVHENILAQLDIKEGEHGGLKKKTVGFFNRLAEKHFNLILAEDSYLPLYKNHKQEIEVIHNFPDHKLLQDLHNQSRSQKQDLFYIGGISRHRGLTQMLQCISRLKEEGFKSKLILVGPVYEKTEDIGALIDKYGVADRVEMHGVRPLREGFRLAKNCAVGLAILSAAENYIDSYPCKIFEYMAVGMPVISSDFPLYKSVVEEYQCGICVDPENVDALYAAVKNIITNEKIASEMAKKGQLAIEQKFNWKLESAKLLKFYEDILINKLASHD